MELEIFKTGNQTSSNGISKNFTSEDIDAIVNNYNPDEDEAPVVVGHPKDNSPAFGWIKSLKRIGDTLIAEVKDIVPEFMEALKNKLYKKRSASFKVLEDGTLALNHVGFLGGAKPAVKGLKDVEFTDQDLEVLEFFEMQINSDENDTDDNTSFSQSEIKDLSDRIDRIQLQIRNFMADLSDSPNEELNDKIDELTRKLDQADFDKLVLDKLDFSNMTPAIKNKISQIISFLSEYDFSEAQDNSKFYDSVLTYFSELIELIKPFNLTEEFADKPEEEIKDNQFDEFSVNEDSLKIHNTALQKAKNDNISYEEAVNRLINS